ncbi:advillin isoform X1 [Diabrotica virgifera virgifera]|uniref:Villin-1 isoform X1 n=2 Tax=Diabrotica virgifera virgifera TaxID=50390 RepID=A0A6P7FYY0_DIAVI|nr:advillin isoform X1 [Diabrotica virgifera virgifera]
MQVLELQHDDYDDSSVYDIGSIDTAFRKINKNSTNFLIWKVENMNIIAIPKDQYGTFYTSDSYVIYAASLYGQSCGVDMVSKETKGSIEHHVHFWLGSQTNPDRSGVAAYKTVEVDNYLNGHAVQHRETEGYESARFLSYFKNGIRILKPEIINDCQPVKLYRVRGKRIPVVKEMPSVSWEHFNSQDIFVIKTPKIIFVWSGRAADAVEKLHATTIVEDMKEKHKIANLAFVDDGYEKTLQDDIKKEFNKYLPLEKRVVLPEVSENDENGNYQKSSMRLYKCADINGKYRVAEVKTGPFVQQDLHYEDVYILDQEVDGIWVWVGRKVSEKERSEALRNARGFVKKKKYPANTKVTRVVDSYEPQEFKMLFASWKSDNRILKPSILVSRYDAVTMEDRPSLAAETQLIDDGTGSLTIWRINQSRIVEIPKERHGNFFSGDCYIILYTYQTAVDQKHLLYCWLGSHATQEEINSTTLKVMEIDEELGQIGFHARIIQGRETAHFLQLFKGKLTIFKGRGVEFDDTGRNLKIPSQYLLHVYGSTSYSTKAVQVSVKASSFNSNYCFVLKRSKKAYIWSGTYSTGDQREMAKGFAGKDFELILEGKEREDFFSLLGGKTPYSTQIVKHENDPKPARLFKCSSSKGRFKAEEILFFSQKDLVPEHVMLLDTADSIYMWIGKLSNKEEKRLSAQKAIDYLQSDPAGRDMNIAIIHIKQEKEPPTFTGFFQTWDKSFWKTYKTFLKIRQEIESKTCCHNGNGTTNGYSNHSDSGDSEFDQYEKYPVNILKEPNEKLPPRIDPLNKELHLTHDDFVSMFKMAYTDFEKLPRWKQQELKKKVGLF